MVINSVEQAQQQFLDNYITFCFTNAYKSENKPTKHVEVIRVWPGLSRRRWDLRESKREGGNYCFSMLNRQSWVVSRSKMDSTTQYQRGVARTP